MTKDDLFIYYVWICPEEGLVRAHDGPPPKSYRMMECVFSDASSLEDCLEIAPSYRYRTWRLVKIGSPVRLSRHQVEDFVLKDDGTIATPEELEQIDRDVAAITGQPYPLPPPPKDSPMARIR